MDFNIDVAEFVLEQPALLLTDAWSELEQAQVLRNSAFAHDLVFDAVLEGIPTPIAQRTHARVATYLAQHDGQAARIAAHWLKAERPRDALRWLKQAAEDAGRALRTKEQFDFLLKAARIEEEQGELRAAFASLHAALEVEGKSGTSLDTALGGRLAALATTPQETGVAGFVQLRQFAHLLRFDEAVAVGAPALKLAQAQGDTRLVNLIKPTLGYTLFYSGRSEEAVAMMESAQSWVDAEAAPDTRMDFHGNFALILDALGKPDRAQRHHSNAIDLARIEENWSTLATVQANCANSRYIVGDIHQAIDLLRESEQLVAMYEAVDAAPAGPANSLAAFYRVVGRYEDALAWANTTLERATTAQSSSFAALARVRQAEIHTDLGQFARAVQELDATDAMPDLPSVIREQTLRARARLQRAMGERFEDTLAKLQQMLPANARPEIRHRMALDQACLAAPLQALAMTERVIEEARAVGHQGTVMAAYARRAGFLYRHDPALAVPAARRAIELASTLDSPAIYRPEIWLNAALAMRSAGLELEAGEQLSQARDWILQRVQDGQVPEPFVDSFLQRNPVNREILALR
jgi:tetratricopeptide (TPR) repeat protein